MHIEIITTPNTELNETGFGNIRSCENVLNSIKKMPHTSRISSCTSLTDLEQVIKRKPDLVVLAVKYISIKNHQCIWLPEYFANNNIAFTGSEKTAISFDSDKVLAKRHLQKLGISTAPFFTAYKGEFKNSADLHLKYPLFLKPNSAANSNGIDNQSHVSNFEEFENKIASLHDAFNQPALVEEYMSGPEYTVALLTTKSGEILVSAIEIIPPESLKGHRILSKNIKTKDAEILRKITDIHINNEVKKLAFDAFIGIGVEGFARIDIKSNSAGKCFFMEINLVPGMTLGSSYFPEAFRIDMEQSYDQTITHIIDYGLTKKLKENQRTKIYSIPPINTNLQPIMPQAI